MQASGTEVAKYFEVDFLEVRVRCFPLTWEDVHTACFEIQHYNKPMPDAFIYAVGLSDMFTDTLVAYYKGGGGHY